MNTMNIPGFNAEASLSRLTRRYMMEGIPFDVSSYVVSPAQDDEPIPLFPLGPIDRRCFRACIRAGGFPPPIPLCLQLCRRF